MGMDVGWLWMALIMFAPILLVLALFKYLLGWSKRSCKESGRAVEILDEAYAKGDISREEYLQKRADLQGK